MGCIKELVNLKVLEANTTVAKMMSLDLNNEENLLSPAFINFGFGAYCKSEKSASMQKGSSQCH